MKNLRQNKKSISLSFIVVFLLFYTGSAFLSPKSNSIDQRKEAPLVAPPVSSSNSIKIALLLDTSGSMDGLLEQTKSQLWKIVNELAMAKKDNQSASLEIALYQYGNSHLNSIDGYVQEILPMSSDLDLLSEKLFSLRTNGGEEYCGQAIKTATNQLDWGTENGSLNLIFIAGNEPFNQGEVNYKESCKDALEKGITINTIFCGDYQNGISTSWLNGAQLTEGNYMNIDMNQKTVYVESPYDQRIVELNEELNKTYIAYGVQGQKKKEQQYVQDNNSVSYGQENMVSRAVSKSNHFYSNTSWDLVDAVEEESFNIESVDVATLPVEMQGMTLAEKQAHVEKKADERKSIQDQINKLNIQREDYIKNMNGTENTNSFDVAMVSAIKKQAAAKGFTFNENKDVVAEIVYQEANVDFAYFEKVTAQAKKHRASRLIDFATFTTYSKDENTIILDTRSKRMYDKMHIKGAIHINFSDFTQQYLSEIIPDTNTRILIYCNNNFYQEPVFIPAFVTKSYVPPIIETSEISLMPVKVNTLALNIPTYINLYGYHYRNVYELHELVSSAHPNLEMEGTDAAIFQQSKVIIQD